ncbi:unnamed protein product, partial [Allacma fusca]
LTNFLEIDVLNLITHGFGNKCYTDYEVRLSDGGRACRCFESNIRPCNEGMYT